jgi:hypothetical protein
MPFPFSIRGSVRILDEAAGLSDDAIIIACVDQIEHEGARVASRSDRSTTFTVPFLSWGSNWRFTVPLSAGSLEIIREPTGGRRLRYDFSTRRIALIGTVAVIGLFAAVALNGVGQFPWWVPVIGWLWLVGANYFISFVRAPSWVRRRISDAVKVSAVFVARRL